MKLPKEEEIPVRAREYRFKLSPEIIERFRSAFAWRSSSIPPTVVARAFTGMFELLNEMQVDWKKLLHTSQSFEYLAPIEENQELTARTQLVKLKKRGTTYWLQFESSLTESESGKDILKAQATILVEDDVQ